MCVCVCVSARARVVCACACFVRARTRERERVMCVVWCVCVCVCVCVSIRLVVSAAPPAGRPQGALRAEIVGGEREGGEGERERERERERDSIRVVAPPAGRSQGALRAEAGAAVYSGTLSTAGDGGFSSVRGPRTARASAFARAHRARQPEPAVGDCVLVRDL